MTDALDLAPTGSAPDAPAQPITKIRMPDGSVASFATDDPQKAAAAAQLLLQNEPHRGVAPGSTEDRLRTIGSGAAAGFTGLLGLPGLAREGVGWAGRKIGESWERHVQGRSEEEIAAERAAQEAADAKAGPSLAAKILPDPSQLQAGVEDTLKRHFGLSDVAAQTASGGYEPGTTAGKIVKAGMAGATGALASGGLGVGAGLVRGPSLLRGLAGQVIEGGAAGVTSEGAGQAADKAFGEGSTASTAARIAGALAVPTASLALRQVVGAPEDQLGRMLKQQLGKVQPGEMQAAETLKQGMAAQGQEVSSGEAIKQVTNGRIDITGLERQAAGRPASLAAMNDAYARRHAEAQAQMDKLVGDVQGPGAGLDPSTAGRRFAQAAEDVADSPRQAVNKFLDPYWKQAAQARVSVPDLTRVLQGNKTNGLDAVQFVRANPTRYALDPAASNPSLSSVGFWGQVYRYAQDQAGEPSFSRVQRAGWSQLANDLRPVLEQASPEWQMANNTTRQVAQDVTRPVRESMTGAIAELAPSRRGAVGPVGPDTVARAVSAQLAPGASSVMARGGAQQASDLSTRVAGRDPQAAGKVIGDVLANQFEGQGPMTGPNAQFTPAKIANKMLSDREQMDRLRAAVAPLHPQAAEGLDNLMNWFRTMGWRQPTGSNTSFNTLMQADAERKLISAGAANTLAHIQDYFNSWRGDKVYQLLAQETWKPDGVKRLSQLAGMASNSPAFLQRALAVTGALVSQAKKTEKRIDQPDDRQQPYDQPGSGP